jgi:uncharacterized lipoprotein YmbA
MSSWLCHTPMAAVSVALTILVGCAGTQPSRFYVLSDLRSLETAQQMTPTRQGPSIGLGPITLPKYLDRPQNATLASRYELAFAEFDRWAEPLETTFARALAERLSTLTTTERIAIYPWPRGTPIDYQVTVEVTHFLGQIGGASALIANWTIARGEGKEVVVSRKSRFNAHATGQEYEAVVAAMSQTVAALGQEIAAVTRTLAPTVSDR